MLSGVVAITCLLAALRRPRQPAYQGKMKRPRPLVFCFLVMGLILWTRSYVRQSAVGSVRQLPDGSSLEVVAVTYGAQHR